MFYNNGRGQQLVERVCYKRVNPLITRLNDSSLFPTVKVDELPRCRQHKQLVNFCRPCQLKTFMAVCRRLAWPILPSDIRRILYDLLAPSFPFVLGPPILAPEVLRCPQFLAYYVADRLFVLHCHNTCSQYIDGLWMCAKHYEVKRLEPGNTNTNVVLFATQSRVERRHSKQTASSAFIVPG